MMTRIDVKMMESKELRELRMYIREELDFRADIGKELKSKELKSNEQEDNEKNMRTFYGEVKENDETKKNSERS